MLPQETIQLRSGQNHIGAHSKAGLRWLHGARPLKQQLGPVFDSDPGVAVKSSKRSSKGSALRQRTGNEKPVDSGPFAVNQGALEQRTTEQYLSATWRRKNQSTLHNIIETLSQVVKAKLIDKRTGQINF